MRKTLIDYIFRKLLSESHAYQSDLFEIIISCVQTCSGSVGKPPVEKKSFLSNSFYQFFTPILVFKFCNNIEKKCTELFNTKDTYICSVKELCLISLNWS